MEKEIITVKGLWVVGQPLHKGQIIFQFAHKTSKLVP